MCLHDGIALGVLSVSEAVPLETLVEQRHLHRGKWSCVRELTASTGRTGNKGRIDVAAICHWPSENYMRIAYEVKRTRRDFERELANPEKRAWVEKSFHKTYFVCARRVCSDEEIPAGWGLLIPDHGSYELRERREAALRQPEPLGEGLMQSIMRSVIRRNRRAAQLQDVIEMFVGDEIK